MCGLFWSCNSEVCGLFWFCNAELCGTLCAGPALFSYMSSLVRNWNVICWNVRGIDSKEKHAPLRKAY